jgi:hypothetical protein
VTLAFRCRASSSSSAPAAGCPAFTAFNGRGFFYPPGPSADQSRAPRFQEEMPGSAFPSRLVHYRRRPGDVWAARLFCGWSLCLRESEREPLSSSARASQGVGRGQLLLGVDRSGAFIGDERSYKARRVARSLVTMRLPNFGLTVRPYYSALLFGPIIRLAGRSAALGYSIKVPGTRRVRGDYTSAAALRALEPRTLKGRRHTATPRLLFEVRGQESRYAPAVVHAVGTAVGTTDPVGRRP